MQVRLTLAPEFLKFMIWAISELIEEKKNISFCMSVFGWNSKRICPKIDRIVCYKIL